MKEIALIFATIYGGLAVILGAFGAHLLKEKFTTERMESFQTGVKYQMYHALVLLAVGLALPLNTAIAEWMS